MAANGLPSLWTLLFLSIGMVGVRSFAMTMNRLIDFKIDQKNPRTCNRPLCTGAISRPEAAYFAIGSAIVFIAACACLNFTCLILSVPALIFSAVYSFMKRFSSMCHFWLGATLGLAPLAGWLSVNANFLGLPPLMLFFAITFWVGAFDIYYAFQDLEIDKAQGLFSIPARFGAKTALALAAFSHAMTVIFFFLTGICAHLSWPWYLFCLAITILLFWEHRMVNPDDLSNINTAFFTLNGIISPLALIGIILGIYL